MIAVENEEYTYEEACEVLGVSRTMLDRAIARRVFSPIRHRGQARKYLLKSEVDAKIGKQLFSQKKPKPKSVKGFMNDMTELVDTGNIVHPSAPTMIATAIMKAFHAFETYAHLAMERQSEIRKEDNARLDAMWQNAINAAHRGLPLMVDQNISKEQAEVFSKEYLSALEPLRNLATTS